MQGSVCLQLAACFLIQCFHLQLQGLCQPDPPSGGVEVHLLPSLFSHNSPKRLLLAARRMIMKICYCRAGKPSGPVSQSQAWCRAGWSAALGPQLCLVCWQDVCVRVRMFSGVCILSTCKCVNSFSWSCFSIFWIALVWKSLSMH